MRHPRIRTAKNPLAWPSAGRCVMCGATFVGCELRISVANGAICTEHTLAQYQAWHDYQWAKPRADAIQVSLERVDEWCTRLASQITHAARLHCSVYGIPRGGLFVAKRLSTLLQVPCIKEFDPTTARSNVLIADDIGDTGKTLRKYKGWDCVVLVKKPWCLPIVKHWAIELPNYIIWPWELARREEHAKANG